MTPVILDLTAKGVRDNAALSSWLRANNVPPRATRVEFTDDAITVAYVQEDSDGKPLRGEHRYAEAVLPIAMTPAEALMSIAAHVAALGAGIADSEAALSILRKAGADAS